MSLRPGFTDPVAGAQATFRAVLDAMSRPGQVRAAGEGLEPPAPLDPATAAVLLTLLDADTVCHAAPWFAPGLDWLAFHCGPRMAVAPNTAGFLIVNELPSLSDLHAGTDEAPEESATVILQVASLTHGARFRLSGPGLANPATLSVTGLPDDFPSVWDRNGQQFPLGVDLILCAGTTVAALPRTVRVEAA